MSLRHRLVLVLLAAIVATTAIATGATYYWARLEIDELLDYQLRQHALALRNMTDTFGRVVVPTPDPAQDFLIQAWDWRGDPVYRSHPNVRLPRSPALGYADLKAEDTDWRVFTMPLGTYLVQIAQPLQLRRALATRAALKILYPLLAIAPVLALLVWWLVGRVLAPLRDLARTIAAREPAALQALPSTGLPHEASLMVDALNELIERLREVLARQREFMADAAHELRTPLTALQLQAQLLTRADSVAARDDAAVALKAGVQRATHLVERLLAYARIDDADIEAHAVVDFSDLTRQVLTEFTPRATAAGLQVHAALAAHATLNGVATHLRSMLGNLLENALRYTPAPGTIALDLACTEHEISLAVTDTGPGIPDAERARIFDRFYRIPGTDAPGSGLGLAMVKRVVDRQQGKIEVSSGAGGVGAKFLLTLPRRLGMAP